MAQVISLFKINKLTLLVHMFTCLGVSGSNVHTLHEIKIKYVLQLCIDSASNSLSAAECNM